MNIYFTAYSVNTKKYVTNINQNTTWKNSDIRHGKPWKRPGISSLCLSGNPVYCTVDNCEGAAADLNNDLVNVQNWANQWLINFSPPKTESLTISNKANLNLHPALFLNNFPVKEVQFHKHLGVTLTQSLRWNKHIDEVCSKCYKKLDLMKHLKFKLDRRSLETIYMSFILPSLDYGDYLYAGTYDSDLCKLDRIHVEAMRNVTGATARSNIILLYEETGWLKLSDR